VRFERRRRLKKGSLDIAPLVDVVLLLLIFFMLTSNLVNQAGFRVTLPRTTATLPSSASPVVMTVEADGDLFLGDVPVPPARLGDRLRRARPGPGAELVIRADREVSHGRVVEVMTAAREAGWESLAVMARPVPPQPD